MGMSGNNACRGKDPKWDEQLAGEHEHRQGTITTWLKWFPRSSWKVSD